MGYGAFSPLFSRRWPAFDDPIQAISQFLTKFGIPSKNSG